VSNPDPSSTSNERLERHSDQHARPTSDRAKAIFVAFLFAIVVVGYLLMTKLADDSDAEHCMMGHRKNCGAIEWPSKWRGQRGHRVTSDSSHTGQIWL
jgi:hypothetical protein